MESVNTIDKKLFNSSLDGDLKGVEDALAQGGSVAVTPDICHNHHNRWLCKNIQSSVKFSNGYAKETALV